ncbi:MAG: hypothetical protein KC635_10725, partial [Myxococcales bacterium]|nr:hypothetical protein [Myxococcales bacterium]
SVQLRAAMGGLDFASQAALLSPVQMHGGGGGEADVHAAAAEGIAGSGGAIPHAAAIQRSFGGHDVSGIQAHVGGAA